MLAWIGGGVGLALFFGGWWAIDAYGDHRELKCHTTYAKAVDATNVDIDALNTEEEKAETILQAGRIKALDAARQVAGQHLATKEQAKALTEIR